LFRHAGLLLTAAVAITVLMSTSSPWHAQAGHGSHWRAAFTNPLSVLVAGSLLAAPPAGLRRQNGTTTQGPAAPLAWLAACSLLPALFLAELLLAQSLQPGFTWRAAALLAALLAPLLVPALQGRSATVRAWLWPAGLLLSVVPAVARNLLVGGSSRALIETLAGIGLVSVTASLAAGLGSVSSQSLEDRPRRWVCAGTMAAGLISGLAISQLWPDALSARPALWLLCGLSLGGCLSSAGTMNGEIPVDYVTGFTIALLGLSVGLSPRTSEPQTILARQRNFYGVLKVTEDRAAAPPMRYLFHGFIVHGSEVVGPTAGRARPNRREPTAYFARATGVGQVLSALPQGRPKQVGVVGLGVATLAAYGERGDRLRFYEIDPAVVECAHRYFNYLRECPADCEIIPGDGRLALEREPDRAYDVLVLDAFSGDAVPVHLLTREAVQTYLRHLKPDGSLVFNISNTHLDLSPVLNEHARGFGLNLKYVYTERSGVTSKSLYAILSRDALRAFYSAPRAPVSDRRVLWTDQRHSIAPLIRWPRGEREMAGTGQ
jgi:hypothetical protein